MLILWQPQVSTLIAIYIYALSAPVTWLYQLAVGKKAAAPVPSDPPPTGT